MVWGVSMDWVVWDISTEWMFCGYFSGLVVMDVSRSWVILNALM